MGERRYRVQYEYCRFAPVNTTTEGKGNAYLQEVWISEVSQYTPRQSPSASLA